MPRKCACCDTPATHIDLMYVDSSDDYYCGFCHAETFYYADYDEGYQLARQEIEDGLIAEIAVICFRQDPPDCPRHWGYLQACIHEVEKQNGTA